MKSNSAFELTGQVALVTASARGIGEACALALAAAGADVVLGLRSKRTGAELAARIRGMGRRVFPVQMNVAKLNEIDSAVKAAVKHFGRIDILVNNAGIGTPAPAERVTEKEFDETLAVNFEGHVFCHSSSGSRDAGATLWANHQRRFASGVCRSTHRVHLLYEQGCYLSPYQVSGT